MVKWLLFLPIIFCLQVCTDKLNNLITDVLILTNSKFIENRVYEEDIKEITSSKPAPYRKDVDQLNSDQVVVKKLKRSINKGITCLANRYDIPPSDFSSSFDRNVLLGNLYVYKNRFASKPLPYLIGSDDFIKDTFVGLKVECDSSPVIMLNQGQANNSEDYDDDYDDQVNNVDPLSNDNLMGNDHQTSYNIGHQPKQHQQPVTGITPSNELDDDDIFASPTREPFFRTPAAANPIGNLFTAADEDDDDDIFTQRVIPAKKTSNIVVQQPSTPSLEAEVEPSKPEVIIPDPQTTSKSTSNPTASSLVSAIHKSSLFATRRKNADFFDSDEDDLFEKKQKPSTVVTPSKPTVLDFDDSKSDVSSNNNDTMTTSSSITTLNESEKGVTKTTNGLETISTVSSVLAKKNVKSRLDSIFSSDDDDADIFSGFSAKKKSSTVASSKTVAESSGGSLFKTAPKLAVVSGFESDSDSDDIFKPKASLSKTTTNKSSNIKPASQANQSTRQQPPPPLSDLPKPKPTLKSSFLSDSDDDADIFAPKSVPKQPATVVSPAEPTPPKAKPDPVEPIKKVSSSVVDPLQQQPKVVQPPAPITSQNNLQPPVDNSKKPDPKPKDVPKTSNDSLESLFGDLSAPKAADPNDSLQDIMRNKAKLNSRRTSRKRPSLKPGQILSPPAAQETSVSSDSDDNSSQAISQPDVIQSSPPAQPLLPELPKPTVSTVVSSITKEPSSPPAQAEVIVKQPSPAALPPPRLVLSSTEESSDDDLFAVKPKNQITSKVTSEQTAKSSPLATSSSTSKLSTVTSSQTTKPLPASTSFLESSDDSDNDIFGASSASAPVVTSNSRAPSTTNTKKAAAISLFSDSDDDTDFLSASLNNKEVEKSVPKPVTTTAAKNLKKSIFDDDSDSDGKQ